MRFHYLSAPLALLFLSSCGGSDSSNGGQSVSIATPAPPASGTPTPSVTPTEPLPAPTIRAYASAVVAGEYFFSDSTESPPFARGFGSRDGFYYPGFKGQMLAYSQSLDGSRPVTTDLTGYIKRIEGYDAFTSHIMFMTAPAEAHVVTPLTTLLRIIDQARLKVQFGIQGQSFGFTHSNPDLLNYDAITVLASGSAADKEDAVKLLGFHLRALALAYVAGYITLGPNPYPGDLPQLDLVGGTLAALPSKYIFTDADLASFLLRPGINTRGTLRSDVLAAAAHLIVAYSDAVASDVSTDNVAQYTNGLYGFLLPSVEALFRENTASAAATASAVTVLQVKAAIGKFTPLRPFPTSGNLFTSTNFYEVRSGGALTLRLMYAAPPSLYAPFAYLPTLDDWAINTDSAASSQRGLDLRLRSVSVPSVNIGKIDVQAMPDGTVVITPLAGFQDVAYFDYVGATPNGDQQTGRAFVTVLP